MTQPPEYPGAPDPDRSEQPSGPPPAAPNPYGQPPQPAPGRPEAPANPYGAGNPYGPPATGQPAYGQAPYGQPPQGQPAFGQAPYGQAYPGGPGGQPRPSQALAVTALVLAFLSCTGILGIVAIALAVVVLLRSRDGRNHGKGMAIAAIVVSVVMMLATAAVVAIAAIGFSSVDDVNDLTSGDCFDAPGLTSDADAFTRVETVSCSEPHDAEVIATVTLSAEEATAYSESDTLGGELCSEAAGDWTPDPSADLEPMYITDRADPAEGDLLACIVTAGAGDQLTERVD